MLNEAAFSPLLFCRDFPPTLSYFFAHVEKKRLPPIIDLDTSLLTLFSGLCFTTDSTLHSTRRFFLSFLPLTFLSPLFLTTPHSRRSH